MTDPKITALAREYAEESANEVGVKFDPQDWACTNCTIEAKNVIKFLLRRFCLVEKSKVESVYNTTWNSWYHTLDVETKEKNQCVLDVLHFLFPEIAKEVEE